MSCMSVCRTQARRSRRAAGRWSRSRCPRCARTCRRSTPAAARTRVPGATACSVDPLWDLSTKHSIKHITSLCSAPYVGWQRDTARICCWTLWCSAPGGRSYRSISAARRAHSSKPASTAVVDRRDRQTDGHSTVIYRPCRIGLLCQQCQKSKPCATSVAPRTTIYHCSQ